MNHTIGILGGGQLGRMTIEACHRLGIKVAILDPGGAQSPAGQLSDLVIEGSFNDEDKIRELKGISDVLTFEIEHVNCKALDALNSASIQPSCSTLKLIQKTHLKKNNLPLGEFVDVTSLHDGTAAGAVFGFPFVLKKRKLAYDGNGNYVVRTAVDVETGMQSLGNTELYAEKWVPFVKELALIVVRTAVVPGPEGILCYPVVETIQRNNICHLVIAPAQVSAQAAAEAMSVARRAVASLSGCGVFGVELFLLADDSVLVNEIAPRPHNSGHYSMEACTIDQFEMHARAVLGLPCPTPIMRVPAALMVNVLGGESMDETKAELLRAMNLPNVGVHWYGKTENRKNRKMGHYTVTGGSVDELFTAATSLGVDALYQSVKRRTVRVGVIMGSDSDLATMKDAAAVLDAFAVSYELTIVSAHRTPSRMYNYAQTAVERGLQVIIAGAGGAAHLPGMVAALTPLPVIGVPVFSSALSGQDSLLSIVQMPKGVPVATVAIGNATNAGLLACRILAATDGDLLQKMDGYMLSQESEVLKKADKLDNLGYIAYIGNTIT